MLLSVPLPDSHDAGSIFDYGGSQWQLAGVTASVAANATWNQLVDQYLGTPCGAGSLYLWQHVGGPDPVGRDSRKP
jgi:hypothetical protein